MRWVALITPMIVLGWIAPPGAFAHDDVIGTSPTNGGQVIEVADDVRVEFAESPTSGSGAIIGPAGQELGGKAVVTGTELVIPMRSGAAAGSYRVEFRGRSMDGHRLFGAMTFEVIPSPAPGSAREGSSPKSATNTGSAPEAESPAAWRDGFPAWLPVGIVGGGIGVMVVGSFLARRVWKNAREYTPREYCFMLSRCGPAEEVEMNDTAHGSQGAIAKSSRAVTNIAGRRERGQLAHASTETHLRRLRRIEWQARRLQRMVEEEEYCIDLINQVAAMTRALQSVALGLVEDHGARCVEDAATEDDPDAATRLGEASAAIARLLRL